MELSESINVLTVATQQTRMLLQVKSLEIEEYPSLVRWDSAERKLPVQSIYRGWRKLHLGK